AAEGRRGGYGIRHYFVSHIKLTPPGPTATFGPLSAGLRRSCQKKSPIAKPRSELATVSDSQCSREAILPALASAAAPYSHGASYSWANGVTAARVTVVRFEGKEGAGRLERSESGVPFPSSGRGG